MFQERIQRNTSDIVILFTDEEELFRKKFVLDHKEIKEWKCTICSKVSTEKVYPHPALRVSICFVCLGNYGKSIFLTNKDGTDQICRWCTKPAKKYWCSSCTVVFCKDCLQRNFDANFIRSRIINIDWNCFICDPKPLWRLRNECSRAMEISTVVNYKENEVIDLSNQDSQEDSQVCLLQSDDDHNITQNNNTQLDHELNQSEKDLLNAFFQKCEKEFSEFNQLMSKRVQEFSDKYKKISTNKEANKRISQLDIFYEKIIENVQYMKQESKKRFEKWKRRRPKNGEINRVRNEEPSRNIVREQIEPKPTLDLERPSTSRVADNVTEQIKPEFSPNFETPSTSKAVDNVIKQTKPKSTLDFKKPSTSKIVDNTKKRKIKQKSVDFDKSSTSDSVDTVIKPLKPKSSLESKKPSASKKTNVTKKRRISLSLKPDVSVEDIKDRTVALLENNEKLPSDEVPVVEFTNDLTDRINNLEECDSKLKNKTINNNYKNMPSEENSALENNSIRQKEFPSQQNGALLKENQICQTNQVDDLSLESTNSRKDEISLKKNEDIAENSKASSLKNIEDIPQTPISRNVARKRTGSHDETSLKKNYDKTENTEIPPPKNNEDIPKTPVRRNVARKRTGSHKKPSDTADTNETVSHPVIEKNSESQKSFEIKVEQETMSVYSNETIIRNVSNMIDNYSSGEQDLLMRVREDFGESENIPREQVQNETAEDSDSTIDFDDTDVLRHDLNIKVENDGLILVENNQIKTESLEIIDVNESISTGTNASRDNLNMSIENVQIKTENVETNDENETISTGTNASKDDLNMNVDNNDVILVENDPIKTENVETNHENSDILNINFENNELISDENNETRTVKKEMDKENEEISTQLFDSDVPSETKVKTEDSTTEEASSSVATASVSDSDDRDSEYEREQAFRALQNLSDISSTDSNLSEDDISEEVFEKIASIPMSDSTDSEPEIERPRIPWEPSDHMMNLGTDRAESEENYKKVPKEHKTTAAKSDSESELSSSESDAKEKDPKLKMDVKVKLNRDIKLDLKPVVVLEKVDFRRCYGLINENGTRFKVTTANSDEDDDEIRRLINLNSLKRRVILSSSEDDCSDSSDVRRKRRASCRILSTSSKSSSSETSESSETDSDSSYKSDSSTGTSSSSLVFDVGSDKDTNYMPEVGDDVLDDAKLISDDSDTDSDVKTVTKKKEKKKGDDSSDEDDENIPNESNEDSKSDWRKDKLLTKRLTLQNRDSSDTDSTNDSTANEILRREEEKYLKKTENEKEEPKISQTSVISSDSDNDLVIVSTDSDAESDNSDVQIIETKRKRESDDEGSPKKNKKGRRNIREVLKDSELREETQKADKEESERKERLSLKQKNLENLLSESQLSEEEVGFVLDIDEETKKPLVTIHHKLVTPLKEHQKIGIKFMWDVCFESVARLKETKGVGCILAHCMGLGKTMQVVALSHTLFTHRETNVKHILIICPLSTVFNWCNEFAQTLKNCPIKMPIFDIRPDRQNTFNKKMFEVRRWKQQGGALIMGYESFQNLVSEVKLNKMEAAYKRDMLESLIDPGPDLVICDEGHMLKNGKTLRFKSLSNVKTRRRIILTGTPLQNNLIEYYHMVNFVKPHLLGTVEEFKNRFVNPIMNGQYEDSSREDIHLMKKRSHILHKKLETTVQRFEESELTQYLPAKHDYVLFFQLTPLQIALYERYLEILDENTKKLFKNYHALQNIWTHPGMLKLKYDKRKQPAQKNPERYDEDFVQAWDPDSEDGALELDLESDWFKHLLPKDVLTNFSYGLKMQALFSVIKECAIIQDKLLVFSSSIDELDLIEMFLTQRQEELWVKGKDYYRMDGTVAPEKRMKYCNEFNDARNTRARLFLVSHKVGGLGLNFTAANRVILMDVSWNPAYDIQSVFRVYRFGQTKDCYIYRFVSMGTMEEVVYSRAVTKLAISCRVVDEHQIKRHFNEDDLQRMYTLNKDFGEPPTPTLPSDRLLAKLWGIHKPHLYKFCDHQSLLENLTNEELNEEEIRIAWEEFKNEEDKSKEMAAQARLPPPPLLPNNYLALKVPVPSASSGIRPYPAIPQPIDMSSTSSLIRKTPQLPPNYRYKRPNNHRLVHIPPSQDLRDHAQYIQQLLYRNPVNSRPSSSKGIFTPSTSNANYTSSTSNANYAPLTPNSNHILPTTNPVYISSTSNSRYTLSTSNSNHNPPTSNSNYKPRNSSASYMPPSSNASHNPPTSNASHNPSISNSSYNSPTSNASYHSPTANASSAHTASTANSNFPPISNPVNKVYYNSPNTLLKNPARIRVPSFPNYVPNNGVSANIVPRGGNVVNNPVLYGTKAPNFVPRKNSNGQKENVPQNVQITVQPLNNLGITVPEILDQSNAPKNQNYNMNGVYTPSLTPTSQNIIPNLRNISNNGVSNLPENFNTTTSTTDITKP